MSLLCVINGVSESLVKQTVAYKIVRQIVDHVYGSDEKISSKDFIHIYRVFIGIGGNWERLIDGDMKSVALLEEVLDRFLKQRTTSKTASYIALKTYNQYRSL